MGDSKILLFMRFILLAGSLLMSIGMLAQTSDKLVARFTFKGCKVTDESGNGSTAVLVGDSLCSCGVNDQSLVFNDRKTALLLAGPLLDLFTTSDFSVSFYFKPKATSLGGAQVILAKQINCSANRAFWVRYNPLSKKIASGISENDTLSAVVTADLNKNACWQYITLVRSNKAYSIYVDGILKDTRSTAARLNLTSATPFKVGEPICPLDRGLIGELDELRFHSKALTQDEITRFNLHPDRLVNGDTLIYLGSSFQTQITRSCATLFRWDGDGIARPDTSATLITPLASQTYRLSMTHSDGCVATDTIAVKVIDPETLDCDNIFLPNAFTPYNTQGRNDRFGISNPFAVRDFLSFEVFDRWGGKVFSAVDQFDSWDGFFNGQSVNPGMYLYRLRYSCKGNERVKSGNLMLLK